MTPCSLETDVEALRDRIALRYLTGIEGLASSEYLLNAMDMHQYFDEERECSAEISELSAHLLWQVS